MSLPPDNGQFPQEHDFSKVLLFSGSSHPTLAKEIADDLGITLGKIALGRFPDGENHVQILENVRGRPTFVLQTVALDPNNHLMELMLIIDALRRASASEISVIIPYFGYCRQDRKDRPRVPITAKLVANLLVNAGAARVVTMDLHAGQVQGFFDIPVDDLHSGAILARAFKSVVTGDFVVVAPDIGSIKLARDYASYLKCDFAVVYKQRLDASRIKMSMLIGDVNGKDVLLADDMCTTAGTLISAAKACREKGANRIFAAVTHGLFVESALERIDDCPIELLFVTDTIPIVDSIAKSKKLQAVSIAPLLSQAIRGIYARESITSHYIDFIH
ncbi:MAG: ribose-phosphate pyrophosphokinase [Parachlamydiaceae bacterium]|nr:ribose-phosphate pyrophosphokinase [Parachlamydiaceae bacterium]